MNIKEKIILNNISKILNLYPITKTKYHIRVIKGRVRKISYSKHKTKSGRQYAKFAKIYFRNKG